MQRLKIAGLFAKFLCIWTFTQALSAEPPASLVERLKQTRAINIESVIENQFGDAERSRGFKVADPYATQASETVKRWQMDSVHASGVCAIRFTDEDRVEYELRGFQSPELATAGGFTITHQGRCGSCSTLGDLAVYLSKTDLTTPARQCSRRFGMPGKKQCFEKEIGFTPHCAESWAYNARHTRQQCLGVCVADYGFFNLLFHRYPGSNVDESGQLRPCLQCDEDKSGPGFKYSAGRTRRNSGVESSIQRADSEIYPLDHSAYFQ